LAEGDGADKKLTLLWKAAPNGFRKGSSSLLAYGGLAALVQTITAPG
jgi:hypothetical protein